MAHAPFVSFLRREEINFAQELTINAIGVQNTALKYLEAMCADSRADLKAAIQTYSGVTCLEDLRNEARSLAQSLPQLRGGQPLSDRQAGVLIKSLISQSIKFGNVAETCSGLAGAEELEELSSQLGEYATGLDALRDAHSAGVTDGIRSARATKRPAR